MAGRLLSSIFGEARAGGEFITSAFSPVDPSLPKGDGRGVILIPGLWGGDASLLVLRGKLRTLGYDAQTWGLGLDNRCGDRLADQTAEVAQRLFDKHGSKIGLIGHSRGGIIAREVARRRADIVDCVITLGSPIFSRRIQDASVLVRALFSVSRRLFAERPECMTEKCDCDFIRCGNRPLGSGVRSCAIWSRDDGVVAPGQCARPDEPSFEVGGSHVGLVANPMALAAIATALAGNRETETGDRQARWRSQ